jgi:hypothetical protein
MKTSLRIFIVVAAILFLPLFVRADEGSLVFSCVGRRADQQTKESQGKTTNGGTDTIVQTKEDWQYVVTLENNDAFTALQNLEIQYIIFYKQEELGSLAGPRLGRQAGSAKIDIIKGNDKAEFHTVSVQLEKASLQGAYYLNGAKEDANANLVGLWIRIYQNGKLIAEMSRPSNLPSKEKWEE